MARYKPQDHNSLLLPEVLSEQIIPGSFAFALNYSACVPATGATARLTGASTTSSPAARQVACPANTEADVCVTTTHPGQATGYV